MLHGDISNRQAPIIAFNLDNLLYENKSKSIFNMFKPRSLNQNFLDIVNNIWYNYEFCIYLISASPVGETYRKLEEVDIQFTSAVHYVGVDNLRRQCQYRYQLYVDSDKDLLSQISSSNAIHLDDLPNYIRNLGRR
jgi:hypothetical protein